MEGINRDYTTKIHNYLIAMTYYEGLLDKGEIMAEEYNQIELKILAKYQLPEESILRMKKRACDCGPLKEIITL